MLVNEGDAGWNISRREKELSVTGSISRQLGLGAYQPGSIAHVFGALAEFLPHAREELVATHSRQLRADFAAVVPHEGEFVSSSISLFGLGYVGSVSAACFAHMGHKVTGVDISKTKVGMLDTGRPPIIEARMEELVASASKSCRLHATTD